MSGGAGFSVIPPSAVLTCGLCLPSAAQRREITGGGLMMLKRLADSGHGGARCRGPEQQTIKYSKADAVRKAPQLPVNTGCRLLRTCR